MTRCRHCGRRVWFWQQRVGSGDVCVHNECFTHLDDFNKFVDELMLLRRREMYQEYGGVEGLKKRIPKNVKSHKEKILRLIKDRQLQYPHVAKYVTFMSSLTKFPSDTTLEEEKEINRFIQRHLDEWVADFAEVWSFLLHNSNEFERQFLIQLSQIFPELFSRFETKN